MHSQVGAEGDLVGCITEQPLAWHGMALVHVSHRQPITQGRVAKSPRDRGTLAGMRRMVLSFKLACSCTQRSPVQLATNNKLSA